MHGEGFYGGAFFPYSGSWVVLFFSVPAVINCYGLVNVAIDLYFDEWLGMHHDYDDP